MIAAVIENKNFVKVKNVPRPALLPGHVLIKVAYGGFCGPTEICIIEGIHPRAKFPLIFCHEISGIVEKTTPGSKFKAGDRVVVNPLMSCKVCKTCCTGYRYICENLKLIGIDSDGGFAEFCAVPDSNVLPIPDSLPLNIAAIVEPVAVGIHAVRGTGVSIGDRLLIFGAGPIGIILAEVSRIAGAGDIVICELDERRLDFAKSLGFETIKTPDALRGEKFDYVIDSSGSELVLPYAVDLVKIHGCISIVGKFDFPVKVNLHDILFKEITMRGFRVYAEDEFNSAISMLSSNTERFSRIITDEYPLADINVAIDAFRKRENICKIIIKV
jgi:(R,R)-butanediol dehydrogenase / meso-butanediol dehydrogenase / diacetyl reductase